MLKLDFDSKDIADEQVLQFFPEAVRQKILRRLYLPSLLETKLMKGTRQQFSDAFLSLCKVEIFSPGEEILQRGSISSDLYLLLDGTVHLSMCNHDDKIVKDISFDGDLETSVAPTSVADSTEHFWSRGSTKDRKFNSKEFLNEVGKSIS
jgi:CRP-like cAMP-binding protein